MHGLRRNGARHGRRPPAAFHEEAARGAPLRIWSLVDFVRDYVSEEDWKVLDEAIAAGAIDPVTAMLASGDPDLLALRARGSCVSQIR